MFVELCRFGVYVFCYGFLCDGVLVVGCVAFVACVD